MCREPDSQTPSWCIEIACGRKRRTCKYAVPDDDGSVPIGETPEGDTIWKSIILYFPGPDCPVRNRKADK